MKKKPSEKEYFKAYRLAISNSNHDYLIMLEMITVKFGKYSRQLPLKTGDN